jgi:hypothetical protein
MKVWKEVLDEGKRRKTATVFAGMCNTRSPVRTQTVVRNKDRCFQVRVYNSCAGPHNKKKIEGMKHSPVVCIMLFLSNVIEHSEQWKLIEELPAEWSTVSLHSKVQIYYAWVLLQWTIIPVIFSYGAELSGQWFTAGISFCFLYHYASHCWCGVRTLGGY